MGQYAKVFVIIVGVFLFTGLSYGFISAAFNKSDAVNYKADVIAEIENSNFNDKVIQSCIEEAEKNGYELTVNKEVLNRTEDKVIAEVVLKYDFKIPILNINNEHQTRGYAR